MNTDQKYKLLSMMGYKGPKSESLMSSFTKSSPGVAAKMSQFETAAVGFAKGGVVKPSFAQGGVTSYDSDLNSYFQKYLGRDIRDGGLQYYNDQINSGALTLAQAEQVIRDSTEAQKYASTPTPAPGTDSVVTSPVVSGTPQQVVPTTGSTVTSPVVSGTPQQAVPTTTTSTTTPATTYQTTTSASTSAAPTSYQQDLNGYFQQYLGRDIKDGGLQYYTDQINSGVLTLAQAEQIIRDSTEAQQYQTRGTSGGTATATGGYGDYTVGGYWTTASDGSSQFVDANGAVTQASSREQAAYDNVNNLFQQYLGRTPQIGGLNYYVGQLTGGRSLEDVTAEIASNATDDTTGGTTDDTTGGTTDDTTGGTTGSTADNNTGGYGDYTAGGYWYNIDANGGPIFVDADGIPQEPPQNEQEAFVSVNRFFQNYGGRAPTLGALNYYAGQITGGRSTADVGAEIARNFGVAPDEGDQPDGVNTDIPTGGEDVFTNLGSTTEADAYQKIQDVFRQSLGRNIEQGELDYYMAQFNDNTPLEDILNEVIRSPKSQQYSNEQWNEWKGVQNAQQGMAGRAYTDPEGNVYKQQVAQITPGEGTLVDSGVGQVDGSPSYDPTLIGTAATATAPTQTDTATYGATQITDELQGTLGDLEAQTALPSAEATVRGQLAILMDDFEDGTPPWASGAMRQAMGIMQKRGLGASSMAGQAIVQSAMESALPIASQDASTFASFEMKNLDNRQQTAIFKAQQRITGLFTDQAADNAAKQFNASSKNQTDQFFASLEESTSKFNAAQINAIAKSDVDSANAAKQFNAQMEDLRDRFNATNSLAIAQSNAVWRQNIATVNTAAQNDANREYAKQTNMMTGAALDQLWQRERDLMSFAYGSSEGALDRLANLMLADKEVDLAKWKEDQAESAAKGSILTNFLFEAVKGWGS